MDIQGAQNVSFMLMIFKPEWSTVSGQISTTEAPLHSPSSLRYSLTEDGLALAERLDSAEERTKDGPEERDKEKVISEGEEEDEEEEEGGPGVVDLTGSDEGEEDKEDSPVERLTCVAQSAADGMGISGKPQAASRKPNPAYLLPGTYEIILCVDFIETTG